MGFRLAVSGGAENINLDEKTKMCIRDSCYFILHQPKVPENLKKFSESKK